MKGYLPRIIGRYPFINHEQKSVNCSMHVFRSRTVDIHYLFNFLLTVGLMTLKLYRIQSYDTTHEVSLSAAQATKFLVQMTLRTLFLGFC